MHSGGYAKIRRIFININQGSKNKYKKNKFVKKKYIIT